MNQPCRNRGCPGHYKEERIAQALRFPDGHLVVIEEIPALVCDFCGDTLYEPHAIEEMERIKAGAVPAIGSVPLFRFGTVRQRPAPTRIGRKPREQDGEEGRQSGAVPGRRHAPR